MRPLPVPLLLLLLSPVPARPGGCPPCPRGLPERGGGAGDPEPGPAPRAAPPRPSPERAEPAAPRRAPGPCPPCGRAAAAPLPAGAPPAPGTARVTPPAPGAPPEPPGDIIPLYCALLAGLVLALVAYVAFKCWGTCRRKRRLDKARDAADAEKPRGDGGTGPESAGPERPRPPPAEAPALLPGSPRHREEPGEPEPLPEPAAAPGDATSAV